MTRRGKLKRTIAGFVAGLVLGAAGVGIAATQTRFITVRPGTSITFAGLDLFCDYAASDADHHDPGPSMYCERASSIPHGSRSFSVSRYHVNVTTEGGSQIVYRVTRAP
jgi:hypothetical protein